MNNKILELLDTLKRRPLMFFRDTPNLNAIQIFVDGLVMGLGLSLDNSLDNKILLWLRTNTNKNYNLPWSDFILEYNIGKSDGELKSILIETLEEYFRENPIC